MHELFQSLIRCLVSGAAAQKGAVCYGLSAAVDPPHDKPLEREGAELFRLAEEVRG